MAALGEPISCLAQSWRAQPPVCTAPGESLDVPDWVSDGDAAALAWHRAEGTAVRHTPLGRRLANVYRYQSIESLDAHARLTTAWRRLEQSGLQPILIKGWSIARLYPDPGLRHVGDADLCFHPSQFVQAVQLCRDFPYDLASTDLHHSVPDLPDRRWDEIFGRTRLEPLDGCLIRVLGWEDHVRLTCRHFARHGGPSPRMLCDVAMLLEAVPDTFDWDECLRGDAHETAWVLIAMGLACRLLGAEIKCPRVRRRAEEFPAWIADDLPKIWATAKGRFSWTAARRRPVAAWTGLRYRRLNPIRASFNLRALPATRREAAWANLRFLLTRDGFAIATGPLRERLRRWRRRPSLMATIHGKNGS